MLVLSHIGDDDRQSTINQCYLYKIKYIQYVQKIKYPVCSEMKCTVRAGKKMFVQK